MWRQGVSASIILSMGAGLVGGQTPALDLTDGSSPSPLTNPWNCDPSGHPQVDVSADASGISLTITYYREALADNLGSPSQRAVHTSGFFKKKTDELRLGYDGDGWLSADSLSLNLYESPYDFTGLCTSADPISADRDNLFGQGGMTTDGTCASIPSDLDAFLAAGCDPITSEGFCGESPVSNDWIITKVTPSENDVNCSAKYVASFTKSVNEFESLGGTDSIVTVDNANGVRQLSWDFYTVELAEAEAEDSTLSVRTTKHSFITEFSTTAAVTVSIDNILSPVFLQVVSVEGSRILENPELGVLDFKLHMYVQQGGTTGNVEQIDLKSLDSPVITSSSWPETDGTATAVCEAIPYETAVENSYFQFATGSRVEMSGDSLPTAIKTQLLQNTTSMVWVQYEVFVRCTYTLDTVTQSSEELVIPSNQISIKYELSKGQDVVSDQTNKPSLSFTASMTLPGRTEQIVQLPFEVSVKNVSDENHQQYQSFSDLVYASENNDLGGGSVAWSQVAGFHVELADPNDRNDFRLDPLLMMVVAHQTPTGAADPPATTYLGTGEMDSAPKLGADFCGLDGDTVRGAMLVSDDSMFTIATQSEIDTYASAIQEQKNALVQTVKQRILDATTDLPGDANDTVSWGSYISEELAVKLATMYLQRNTLKSEDIDSFANIPAINGVSQPTYYIHDSTAGYMVPFRNRVRLSTGEGGGFEIRFCAITQVSTHQPVTVDGQTDLYVSSSAAELKSAVNSATPVVVNGIKYFRPDSARRMSSRRLLDFRPIAFSVEAEVSKIPERAGLGSPIVKFEAEKKDSNETVDSANDGTNIIVEIEEDNNDFQDVIIITIIIIVCLFIFFALTYFIIQNYFPNVLRKRNTGTNYHHINNYKIPKNDYSFPNTKQQEKLHHRSK